MWIDLTQGYQAEIDFSDWWKVQGYSWCVAIARNNMYAVTSVNGRLVYMHKLIRPGPEVDHRNGNGLNNRWGNLRIATRRQNNINRLHTNAAGYRGIAQTAFGNWQAQIRVEGRRIYLGRFDTAEDAARAYDEAAKLHHGEFAILNFKDEIDDGPRILHFYKAG